jgi:ABC-type proline/glycine betaine transport system permease subunit
MEKRKQREEEKNTKKEDREDRSSSRRSYRLDKIKAVTAKAYAVATKRKWLVFLIGIALVAYFVISSGGLGGLGGIVEKVKGFF